MPVLELAKGQTPGAPTSPPGRGRRGPIGQFWQDVL